MKTKVWHIFYIILAFTTFFIGSSFIVGIFLPITKSIVVSTFIGRMVFFIPFIYILFKKTNIQFFKNTQNENNKFNIIPKLLIISITLALISKCYGLIFTSTFDVQKYNNETSLELISYTLGVLFLAPIAEELFFRKWMIDYLNRVEIKPFYILIITSFLFFIAHINLTSSHIRLDALIFAITEYHIYKKYHNIKYCIFVHFMNNLFVNFINIIIYICLKNVF